MTDRPASSRLASMSELNPTKPGSLVSRVEVREILGVSKQRVHVAETLPGFPRPIDVVENGKRPIWQRKAIERYAARRDEAKAAKAAKAAETRAAKAAA